MPKGPLLMMASGNSVTGARRRDAADAVAGVLGKPDIAVRPGRDAARTTVAGQVVLGDDAGGVMLPMRLPCCLGEPQIAVRPGRDRIGGSCRG